jgi:hypothetical protein
VFHSGGGRETTEKYLNIAGFGKCYGKQLKQDKRNGEGRKIEGNCFSYKVGESYSAQVAHQGKEGFSP